MARNPIKADKVLELLADGWELALSSYVRGGLRAWMQPKIGHGGESHSVHLAAFNSLRRKGLIVQDPRDEFPKNPIRYRLPDQGGAGL